MWRQFVSFKLFVKPGTRGAHHQNGGDARGLGGRAQRNRMTEGDFLLHQQDRNPRARQCRDWPAGKPPRQWLHAAGQHPASPASITPGIHLVRLSQASAKPTHRGRRRRSLSTQGGPLERPPHRRQLHALWRLPELGATKSRGPLGWRNCRRQ